MSLQSTRHYRNSVPAVPLTVEVGETDTTISIDGDTADFPPVPFFLTLGRKTAKEEVVLCTAKPTAATLDVLRGQDGTDAPVDPHPIGTLVEHTSTALDYREAGVARFTDVEATAIQGDSVDDWMGRTFFNEDQRTLMVSNGANLFVPLMPIGTILPFGGSTPPDGWLHCDGSEVARATYPALFDAIGEAFGAGDGVDTFNLPDAVRRFPIGSGTTTGTGRSGTSAVGDAGGELNHTHSGPSHAHSNPNVNSNGSHAHTNPNVNSQGSHSHSQGDTGSGGSHVHSINNSGLGGVHAHGMTDTSFSGQHDHSQGSTGAASVGSEASSDGASGLLSRNDIQHNHSFSDSFGTSGDSHTHTTGGGGDPTHFHGSTGGDTHSHSGSVSGTTGGASTSRAHHHDHALAAVDAVGGHNHGLGLTNDSSDHRHSIPNANSNGAHTHSNPNVNTNGSHAHSQGNTGTDGSHVHSQGNTGSAGTGQTGGADPSFLVVNMIIFAGVYGG